VAKSTVLMLCTLLKLQLLWQPLLHRLTLLLPSNHALLCSVKTPRLVRGVLLCEDRLNA
jgi:hypothetical protein